MGGIRRERGREGRKRGRKGGEGRGGWERRGKGRTGKGKGYEGKRGRVRGKDNGKMRGEVVKSQEKLPKTAIFIKFLSDSDSESKIILKIG